MAMFTSTQPASVLESGLFRPAMLRVKYAWCGAVMTDWHEPALAYPYLPGGPWHVSARAFHAL